MYASSSSLRTTGYTFVWRQLVGFIIVLGWFYLVRNAIAVQLHVLFVDALALLLQRAALALLSLMYPLL